MANELIKVCIIKEKFQVASMTLESRVEVTYI